MPIFVTLFVYIYNIKQGSLYAYMVDLILEHDMRGSPMWYYDMSSSPMWYYDMCGSHMWYYDIKIK